MKIKFVQQNYKKIIDKIDSVEYRCTARLLTIKDVEKYLVKVENRLSIHKKYLEGTRVQINPNADHFAQAYNGIPYGTACEVEYCKGFWHITKIYRMRSRKERDMNILLSETARAAVLKKYEHSFDV